MVRFNVDQHFPNLTHEIDSLVERHNQIAFGKFDLGADFGHRGAAGPGARGAIEVGIVPLGDGQSFAALLAQYRVLDIFDAAARKNQPVWEDKAVAVPELAVEREPGEEFGQVFRSEVVEYAAVDQFAEDQAVVVENLRQHVGLLGWIAAMQVAEPMQDVADASDDVAQSFLFEI